MTAPPQVRRTAVVTGAAGGLGAEIVADLARAGTAVVLMDLHQDPLEAVAAQVREEVPDADLATVVVDLTDEDAVGAAFAGVDQLHGRLDVLVNTAGGSGTATVRDLQDLTADIWRAVLDSNLTSTFLCCKHAVPLMARHGHGRIVNFSSAVAHGIAGPSGTVGARLPYAASKAAVNGLTKQLAKDLGHTGITVNAVSPGLILPARGRVRASFEALSAEAQAATRAAIPLGRTGTGSEIAHAVAYLVSDAAGFTSGSVLDVDGAAT